VVVTIEMVGEITGCRKWMGRERTDDWKREKY